MVNSVTSVTLVDVVSAYYASKGEIAASSLNGMCFRDVIPILDGTQKFHKDLIELSAQLRAAHGPICHMECHIHDMITNEGRNHERKG